LVGGCYDFDGHDDRIAVMDDDDLTSEEAFTLSTWIYYTGGEQFDTIMLKGSEYWMRLTDYGLGTLNLTTYIYLNGIWAGVVYGPEPLEDEWIQVVCTWDNSTGYLKLYVNGEVTYSAPSLSGAVTNGAGNLLIGGNGGTGAWNGSVDETKVYHRALSPEQIALEYQAGLAGEQVETIVSQETSDGEHWQVVVTPNDGEDGISGLSNSLLVGGPEMNCQLLRMLI